LAEAFSIYIDKHWSGDDLDAIKRLSLVHGRRSRGDASPPTFGQRGGERRGEEEEEEGRVGEGKGKVHHSNLNRNRRRWPCYCVDTDGRKAAGFTMLG
jgi:hypothetical protein